MSALSTSFDDVLVTYELDTRPRRIPQLRVENEALRTLARLMARDAQQLPDRLLQLALKLCNADGAGISLLAIGKAGEQVFNWSHLAGTYKQCVGRILPRHFSPCGATLDTGKPQLFSYPSRYFAYFQTVEPPPIVEFLVVPVPDVADRVRGTLWIVSHDPKRKFDAEDVRLIRSLAEFGGSAIALTSLLREEHEAREQGQRQIDRRTAALRSLSSRLMQMQDEEHRRIARNLHDSVGQHLVSVKMNLAMMEHARGVELSLLVEECKRAVDNCLSETRTISHLLHPPLLDEAGLASAVREFLQEFSKRSGIDVDYEIPEHSECLPGRIGIALFRVLQECLSNIHRHSGSKRARVTLMIDAENVSMIVADDGRGLPDETLESFRSGTKGLGVGLAGMRERIQELNGNFLITSSSAGTTITVTVPCEQENVELT